MPTRIKTLSNMISNEISHPRELEEQNHHLQEECNTLKRQYEDIYKLYNDEHQTREQLESTVKSLQKRHLSPTSSPSHRAIPSDTFSLSSTKTDCAHVLDEMIRHHEVYMGHRPEIVEMNGYKVDISPWITEYQRSYIYHYPTKLSELADESSKFSSELSSRRPS